MSLLQNYLYSNHHFTDKEEFLKFQFQFFNTILISAIFVPPMVSFFHYPINLFLVISDNLFALISLGMVFLLRRNKNYFKLAANIFLPSLFFAITAAFFLSGDDASKISWAPILFACAFLLQGLASGFFWFALTLLSYIFGYVVYGPEGIHYSAQELFLTSTAYFTMNIIFSAFVYKNSADNTNLNEMNTALKEKSEALVDFNSQLENRINHALQENQNKTQSMQRHLNMINEHILTVSIGIYGLITNVSSAYCKTTGYGKSHFIGLPFTAIFHTDISSVELKSIWNSLEKGEVYQGEIYNVTKESERYWLDLSISPEYSSEGELIGYIAIAHNITDKKLVLQQHEQLISQSRHAAMGEMISMIAHQWRQPLSSIMAATSKLRIDIELDKYEAQKTKNSLNDIESQVLHLSTTVEDFRDFFKPAKGIEETYVHLLVQEALRLVEYKLKHHVKIIYQEKVDLSLPLYKNELIQVLINIFNNACDAFEEKGIEACTISINEYIQDEFVIIEIQDNAGGIKEEALEYIFDPYFSTKNKEGTGLGLHMSKTIVQEHQQGKLEAYNSNDGAVFKLSLPLASCKLNDK